MIEDDVSHLDEQTLDKARVRGMGGLETNVIHDGRSSSIDREIIDKAGTGVCYVFCVKHKMKPFHELFKKSISFRITVD